MWMISGAVIGLIGLVIVTLRLRRKATAPKDIDVGTVSQSWMAQHRGSRQQ
jgi:hypothetical protein